MLTYSEKQAKLNLKSMSFNYFIICNSYSLLRYIYLIFKKVNFMTNKKLNKLREILL